MTALRTLSETRNKMPRTWADGALARLRHAWQPLAPVDLVPQRDAGNVRITDGESPSSSDVAENASFSARHVVWLSGGSHASWPMDVNDDVTVSFSLYLHSLDRCCSSFQKHSANGSAHCYTAQKLRAQGCSWHGDQCSILHVPHRFALRITWSGRFVLTSSSRRSCDDVELQTDEPQRGTVATEAAYPPGYWLNIAITSGSQGTSRVSRLVIGGKMVGEVVDGPLHTAPAANGRSRLTIGRACNHSPGDSVAVDGRLMHVRFASVALPPPKSATEAPSAGDDDDAWLVQRRISIRSEGAREIVRALEEVVRRPSDCVPPRALAATMINSGMQVLHAMQLRAVPKCFVDRLAVVCSGAVETNATCIRWPQLATSALLKQDFIAITWARWELMHLALTSRVADAVLWVDGDVQLLQNPWPRLPDLRDAFDIAYAQEFVYDAAVRERLERCAIGPDASDFVNTNLFPANLNTGVMLIRNASLVRAVLRAPRVGDGWEQPISNTVLRHGWRWRFLPADEFASFCHSSIGRKLVLAEHRLQTLRPPNLEEACAQLSVDPCRLVAMHANCAILNETAAELSNARNLQKWGRKYEGTRWARKRSKIEVAKGALKVAAACAGYCGARAPV